MPHSSFSQDILTGKESFIKMLDSPQGYKTQGFTLTILKLGVIAFFKFFSRFASQQA